MGKRNSGPPGRTAVALSSTRPGTVRVSARRGASSSPSETSTENLQPLLLVHWGQSLTTHPLSSLERGSRALQSGRLHALFSADAGIVELALLRTCHRNEVYAILRDPGATGRLRAALGPSTEPWTLREGAKAVHHLFRVSAGLDSLAVGEREVRDQVGRAGSKVLSRNGRPMLHKLFESALEQGATRESDPEAPSVASLVVERLLSRSWSRRPRVLVLGTGAVARRLARLLLGKADVTLLYHRTRPGATLLAELSCRCVSLRSLGRLLPRSEVLIAAAKGGEYVVHPRLLGPGRRRRPLLIFDMGLPRNVDPRVGESPRVELWDLARLRSDVRPRGGSMEAEELASRSAERAYAEFSLDAEGPLLSVLWRHAEKVRREELQNALEHAPHLGAQEQLVLSRMSERLVRRLLAGPTRRLRSDGPGALRSELLRELLALFQGPEE